MALQGTLDTFALPDVLRLLATTKKTGRLVIQGDGGNGSLWLDDGAVVGGEVSTATSIEPVDVLFELLRVDDGSFLFDPDDLTSSPGDAVDIESLIAESQQTYDEWRDLSQVIPSLDVGIGLVPELPGETASIDTERWRLVVGIGSGTTVRALGDRLGLTEMPVLRAVRGVIDDGLVELRDGAAAGAPAGFGDLPTLGDAPDPSALFGDNGDDGMLPEPLPGGSDPGVSPDPFHEAAAGEDTGSGASATQHRDLDPDVLLPLPPTAGTSGPDDDPMGRFLTSVRS